MSPQFALVDPRRKLEYAFTVIDTRERVVVRQGFTTKAGVDDFLKRYSIMSEATRADFFDNLHETGYSAYLSMAENEHSYSIHVMYVGHSQIAIQRSSVHI
ncbi:hypothetical protein SEA_AVAZAK_81 [Gordonia phage Avazak]|uniref:Uncharacterized protein n=1 Tax=Gordonia phage Avazak TaxID=2656529 RepID=A0A649V6P8_9CAUD|nr:hypothetical protein HWC78_gp81 [Gordonia phage Avazak]QGJ88058.1 hypothetical protein SEA_AVAZAK_81 [Gordonia phage Avazak]